MRSRRTPARWLAPLALLACAVAVYSVVNANLTSGDRGDTRSTASKSSTTAKSKTVSERSKAAAKRRSRRTRTYAVKSGDTLSSIAIKTGLTLERIQQLNPKLDSQSLQTGQRVKLSP
jgi:LysM repeat protein